MTLLDKYLDLVVAKKHEVTFDVQGYTPEQRRSIIDAAKARGLHCAGDGRHLLVRDLRGIEEN